MFCFEARNTYLRVPLRGLRHEKQPSKIQLQLLGICLHTTRLNFGYICREQIGTGPGASSGAGYRARWGGGAGAGSAEEVPELPDEVLVEVPGQVPEHLADTLSLHVVTLICFRGVTLTCRHVCALPKTKFINLSTRRDHGGHPKQRENFSTRKGHQSVHEEGAGGAVIC